MSPTQINKSAVLLTGSIRRIESEYRLFGSHLKEYFNRVQRPRAWR